MTRHRRTVIVLALSLASALVPTGAAVAAPNPSGAGQPAQSCGSTAAPDAPVGFATGGFANAETHYAGSAPQNSSNPKSVSQYDVACYQVSQRSL